MRSSNSAVKSQADSFSIASKVGPNARSMDGTVSRTVAVTEPAIAMKMIELTTRQDFDQVLSKAAATRSRMTVGKAQIFQPRRRPIASSFERVP